MPTGRLRPAKSTATPASRKVSWLPSESEKRRYNPEFWRDNAVVKDSPVKEQIIQDFEGRKVLGKLN